jgi:N-acetylmuramoyl-L-alanine amidase
MIRNRLFAIVCALFVLLLNEARAERTIVLDPGHGGFDRGGVPYQRIPEKDKNLDVALRLRTILRGAGYRVIMTRDTDVFIPLGTRVAIANTHRDATFVSIHFNCATRSGANGIETYYYRSDSAGLAASIHRNVVAGTSTDNRGIRRRGFFVLRRTAIPSVLVECGFLTNPTEGALAQTASYRQRLAEQIARGIQRQPVGIVRPLVRGSFASSDVLPQPFNGPDFVKAAPRERRSSHSSKSSHKKKHGSGSSKHKKSSSKKKKSSDD